MKRIISILTAVLYGFTGLAQDKVALGLDLTPDISDGYICICGGHGFSKRWSAAFSAEMNMIQAVKERDQEYDDHLSEFGEVPHRINGSKGVYRLGVRYWMKETYEGVYMGIGCRCSKDEKPYCNVDIGYSIPVCRSIRLMLSYGIDLTESATEGKPSGQGLRLGLRWAINTKGK
jgi:hypothetical protein